MIEALGAHEDKRSNCPSTCTVRTRNRSAELIPVSRLPGLPRGKSGRSAYVPPFGGRQSCRPACVRLTSGGHSRVGHPPASAHPSLTPTLSAIRALRIGPLELTSAGRFEGQ